MYVASLNTLSFKMESTPLYNGNKVMYIPLIFKVNSLDS